MKNDQDIPYFEKLTAKPHTYYCIDQNNENITCCTYLLSSYNRAACADVVNVPMVMKHNNT